MVRNKIHAKLIKGRVRNGALFLYFMPAIYHLKSNKSDQFEKDFEGPPGANIWRYFGIPFFSGAHLGAFSEAHLGLLDLGFIWRPIWGIRLSDPICLRVIVFQVFQEVLI